MKPGFVILPLAIALSACAQNIMTADASPCDKPVAAPFRLGGSAALLGSNIGAGLEMLARDDRDSSRVVRPVVTADCAHKNPTPRTYDLHKIGDEPAPPVILIGSNGGACPKARGA